MSEQRTCPHRCLRAPGGDVTLPRPLLADTRLQASVLRPLTDYVFGGGPASQADGDLWGQGCVHLPVCGQPCLEGLCPAPRPRRAPLPRAEQLPGGTRSGLCSCPVRGDGQRPRSTTEPGRSVRKPSVRGRAGSSKSRVGAGGQGPLGPRPGCFTPGAHTGTRCPPHLHDRGRGHGRVPHECQGPPGLGKRGPVPPSLCGHMRPPLASLAALEGRGPPRSAWAVGSRLPARRPPGPVGLPLTICLLQVSGTSTWQRLWTSSLQLMHLKPCPARPHILSLHRPQYALCKDSGRQAGGPGTPAARNTLPCNFPDFPKRRWGARTRGGPSCWSRRGTRLHPKAGGTTGPALAGVTRPEGSRSPHRAAR